MRGAWQAAGWMMATALASGCGGATDRNGDQPAATANAGGSGTGGSTATSTAGEGARSGAEAAPRPGPMLLSGFESDATLATLGLWMGFDGNTLPIEEPPVPHDGSALHLVGNSGAQGLEVMYHTPAPVERLWKAVSFWVQSDLPDLHLTVAIAGPEFSYFEDRAQGLGWPERKIEATGQWREVLIELGDLGIGPETLSPHSGPFGAVHFIIEPNTDYDLWLDDLVGEP